MQQPADSWSSHHLTKTCAKNLRGCKKTLFLVLVIGKDCWMRGFWLVILVPLNGTKMVSGFWCSHFSSLRSFFPDQFHCTGHWKNVTYRLYEICIYTIIAATGKCQTITLGASRIKHILNTVWGDYEAFVCFLSRSCINFFHLKVYDTNLSDQCSLRKSNLRAD